MTDVWRLYSAWAPPLLGQLRLSGGGQGNSLREEIPNITEQDVVDQHHLGEGQVWSQIRDTELAEVRLPVPVENGLSIGRERGIELNKLQTFLTRIHSTVMVHQR